MPSTVTLEINGQKQSFAAANVAELVQQMELKTDRVAVERNGEIVARARWTETPLTEGDRLEIVHFVGGGV
jgi:thiamine biosynthesis protein ThiS